MGVSHPSTNRAQNCLTSVIVQEPVFPSWSVAAQRLELTHPWHCSCPQWTWWRRRSLSRTLAPSRTTPSRLRNHPEQSTAGQGFRPWTCRIGAAVSHHSDWPDFCGKKPTPGVKTFQPNFERKIVHWNFSILMKRWLKLKLISRSCFWTYLS